MSDSLLDYERSTTFLNSLGDGMHETIPFKLTRDIPDCSCCGFRYNLCWVAPCFECRGRRETGKS